MVDEKLIRVMLVDDHAVVRSGLATFLLTCDNMELVGEASSGEQALTLCGRARPDVILMDLVMPGMDGATATRLIREKYPEIQVIVLTSFKEQNLVKGLCRQAQLAICLKMCLPLSWRMLFRLQQRVGLRWLRKLLRFSSRPTKIETRKSDLI